jgi:hypothetical protein
VLTASAVIGMPPDLHSFFTTACDDGVDAPPRIDAIAGDCRAACGATCVMPMLCCRGQREPVAVVQHIRNQMRFSGVQPTFGIQLNRRAGSVISGE